MKQHESLSIGSCAGGHAHDLYLWSSAMHDLCRFPGLRQRLRWLRKLQAMQRLPDHGRDLCWAALLRWNFRKLKAVREQLLGAF